MKRIFWLRFARKGLGTQLSLTQHQQLVETGTSEDVNLWQNWEAD